MNKQVLTLLLDSHPDVKNSVNSLGKTAEMILADQEAEFGKQWKVHLELDYHLLICLSVWSSNGFR